jgi:uncharacterized membrane protein
MADSIQIKKRKKMRTKYLMPVVLIALPCVYLAFIWQQLPAIVPLHYNLKGEIDKWGSKESLVSLVAALTLVSVVVYLSISNVHRIKTKFNAAQNGAHLRKVALGVCCFLAIVQFWLIHNIKTGGPLSSLKFILICIALLFSFTGNYLYNIKPNYFAGFRLPWTLSNGDNWRQTHHFASRLWFAGGLLLAFISLFLSFTGAVAVFFIALLVMIIVPTVYSYRLHRKSKA